MSSTFKEYSQYYDLLYQDKDYDAEVDFIQKLIQQYAPQTKSILELGCGTGKHASKLKDKGYDIFGIDLSETMIEQAQKLNVDCKKADVRTFRADKKFDAVISLFHVASYQVHNQDLKNYFKTASKHLSKGGIFIFDSWYGPAVINIKPEPKSKTLENNNLKIQRNAQPQMHINENYVDVVYDISVHNKQDSTNRNIQETHSMRYLFKPEIEQLLEDVGIKLIYSKEWISENNLSENSWNACFIGEKY